MRRFHASKVPGAAREVARRLEGAGHRALFVGGAVRDILLGREPEDCDVATSARPEEVRAIFEHVVPVGERFGVELVVLDGETVEVATFRREAAYADGRHPDSVTYTDDPAEDAQRRDFTVNGLFADPGTDQVLDWVRGREDLQAGLIRAIGDARDRFREDRLRLLRAVRFACELGFEIEAGTWAALVERAPDVVTVSPERTGTELVRIISGPSRARGLELLHEAGLLAMLLPEVAAMAGVEQPPDFHPEGDVLVHTGLVLGHLESPSRVLAVAALLHDIGKPPTYAEKDRIRFDGHAGVGAGMAEPICRRLRLSRAETDQVVELVRDHLRFLEVTRMREAKLRRFLTSPLAEAHLALHRADCLGSHGKLDNYEFCLERRRQYLAEPPPPDRLLTGRDLIDMGLEPGPRFAEILDEVEDLTLEGSIGSREEALELVRTRYLMGGQDAE